jgi:hypothetical protein
VNRLRRFLDSDDLGTAAAIIAVIASAGGVVMFWMAADEAAFNRNAVETVAEVRSITDCESGGQYSPSTCHFVMMYSAGGRRFDVDRRADARPDSIRWVDRSSIYVLYDSRDPSTFRVVAPDPSRLRAVGLVFLVMAAAGFAFAAFSALVNLRRRRHRQGPWPPFGFQRS